MVKRIIPLILLLLGACCTVFAAKNVFVQQKRNSTFSQPSKTDVTPKKDNAPAQSSNYLTFTAEVDGSTFGISYTAKRPIKSWFVDANGVVSETIDTTFAEPLDAQYSLDNGQTWIDFKNGESVTLGKKGDKALMKGENQMSGFSTPYRQVRFIMTGSIAASGSVMSLIDGKGERKAIPELSWGCFASLFRGCTCLTQAPQLPATTLGKGCYMEMFDSCTSLTQAPALPATKLVFNCYEGMFEGCTNLTQAPQLPATQLEKSCYSRMFSQCTSLTQAPALPATTLADICYVLMFEGCTSLTQAPALPATKLSWSCYAHMFERCSSLTQAPDLPATALEYSCYNRMFSKCTSLTKAPQLPATTLEDLCYSYMFDSCTSLAQAPALPATVLSEKCYLGMFYDCTSLTEAPQLPATTLMNNCYNKMFAGCTSLTQAPDLPATTLVKWCYREMFLGCANLSSIKVNFINWGKQYRDAIEGMKWDTDSWVSDVAPSGTFICPDILPKIFNDHRIPKGWKAIKN